MNHEALRKARETLGLTPEEMARLTEVDVSSVYKWERDPGKTTARPAPVRVARLMGAYLDGWRPGDWPERLRGKEPLPDEVRT
ncbi:transcriptional regulator [Ruegeria phage DSS3-P1]|uniref:transcriptional regulator n=1 Tax=Ruegeria phage DSS3-P1 TaxID=1555208 RepID=UPI00051AA53F|nr:transcriptional regulator [Ruegeria phage DSS3-P1]YP_009997159.1 transcriptional regulator [Ruegeria phage vB_RpoS-V16]YP_009997239.1 transcriptional regulator [Ruegeria phage vB_RpoS-V18]YP_009997321.1 transcriptional regulator [Ruegeria phage vB_RpoS-V11]YP_009997404.1 transcriptional regulator [Ruegeria phage vB_RpoS-V7]AIT13257.1 HTH-domain containing protein [Ruegeria phage DSS3-P1]AWY08726.1 HTH-domain containing protein [Ruegeria phage vB_RpoS-V7]AWY08898.1 HTH-domain containing pr